MSKDFEQMYNELKQCPCGHSFRLVDAKPRGSGGKWMNKSVEHSSITGRIEVQCPKCLLWFDALTGEIE